MRNGREAASSRRKVALAGRQKQLEAWKTATTDEEILSLMSTKDRKSPDFNEKGFLSNLRSRKIATATADVERLQDLTR